MSGGSCGRRQAWRLRPVGVQPGLRPVQLLGTVAVDPRRDDFLQVLIERRQEVKETQTRAERAGDPAQARYADGLQHGLKILANAVYGILAEVDEQSARQPIGTTVFGLRTFRTRVARHEAPGRYAFPPLAACITAGARLLLALLEAELAQLGAAYAFCDTDSIAVVGPPGTDRALRQRLARLTPYSFGGDLLKREPVNDPDPRASHQPTLCCLAVSAKRYACFNIADDGTVLVRPELWPEHGLGHLLAPQSTDTEWIAQLWAEAVRWVRAESAELGAGLPFADLPAVGRFPIMQPSVWKRFAHLNFVVDPQTGRRRARPYRVQVKPFNFMLPPVP